MIDPVEIVRQKEAELIKAHRDPVMILLSEILNDVAEQAKEELRQAVRDKILKCHSTLNDVAFNTNQ